MAQIDVITGQTALFEHIQRLLLVNDRPAIAVRGPSGSGKTRLAQLIARSWAQAGRVAFFARGDDVFARRPLFPLLLEVATEIGREQSKVATRVALAPVGRYEDAMKQLDPVLGELVSGQLIDP